MKDIDNNGVEELDTSRSAPIADISPDVEDIPSDEISEAQNDTDDLNIIESLSLEDILYDIDDLPDEKETPEDALMFESFLADYKETMAEVFANAKAASKEKETQSPVEEAIEVPTDEESVIEPYDEEDAPLSIDRVSEDSLDNDISPSPEDSQILPHYTITDVSPASASEKDEAIEQIEIDIAKDNVPHTEPPEEVFEKEEDAEASPPISEKSEKSGIIHSIFDFVELFVFTLVAVMILTSFFFRHSVVDGPSMQNTLQDGDHLIITGFMYTPDYGDVVVFQDDAIEEYALVKRVIALPGDTVDFHYAGGKYELYINGELKSREDEPYVYIGGSGDILDQHDVVGLVVPEGQVFVLGDHRNVSKDSRIFGTISTDCILGKVVLRFYPFSEFGAIK